VEKDSVVVSVPERCPMQDAERFVESKMEWINNCLQNIRNRESKRTLYSHETKFSTKFRTMKLIPDGRADLRLKILDSSFEIYYPQDADLESESVQAGIRRAVEHVWRVEAETYLPLRTEQLSKQSGLTYRSLEIKNTRSFWGRCSANDAVVLSLHLMHLPAHLVDYVILHELCHTIHKNHQKEFWMLLNSFTDGKAKALAKEMKNHSTKIY
jgi:predicted metal-dependent hydrolase